MFKVQRGTQASLIASGGIDGSIVDNVPGLSHLPRVGRDPNKVHIKFERGAITYGLRRNTIGIFNGGIKSFRQIGLNGNLF